MVACALLLPGAVPDTVTAVPTRFIDPAFPEAEAVIMPPLRLTTPPETNDTPEALPEAGLLVIDPLIVRFPIETTETGLEEPPLSPVPELRVNAPPVARGATKFREAVTNVNEFIAKPEVNDSSEEAGKLPELAGVVLSASAGCELGLIVTV